MQGHINEKIMSEKKINVSFLLPTLEAGGTERNVVNLVNNINKEHYAVSLVLGNIRGDFVSQVHQGIAIVDLKASYSVGLFFALVRYFKIQNPDVFVSAFPRINIITIAAKIFSGANTKIIITEHSVFSFLPVIARNFWRGLFARFFMPGLAKFFYLKANAIICVSGGIAKDILNIIPGVHNTIEVIFNPVISDDIYQLANEPVEHPWFLTTDIPVILAVGRLVKCKDYPTLFKAFSQVLKNQPARLVILGGGPEEQRLKSLAIDMGLANNIAFLGFQKNPFKYMKRASVFVLSSLQEGFGNVIIEAMACGAPVVSTDCPAGPGEIIKPMENGILIPTGDPTSMAEAIVKVLDDSLLAEKFIREGKKRAEFFSVKKSVEEYEKVFRDMEQTVQEEKKSPGFFSVMVLAIFFFTISSFDKGLAVGLLFLLLLSIGTIFFISKTGIKDGNIGSIFFLAIMVHLGAALFIYYGNFKPFGGGADFHLYHQTATEIAHRFGQGNFSLAGLYADHFFPVLIGILYTMMLPSMIVGQLFTVWLAGISVALVYFIVLEIGGTRKIAFGAGLIAIFYPSYLYFGSVLLKDTVVIPLAFFCMLVLIKICKHFSWGKFLLFFIALTCLINLRFYVGYALMFTLILSWLLLSAFSPKKRIFYWFAMVFFLGFSSQIAGNGYYGFGSFKTFLNPESITYYREVVYNSSPSAPQKQIVLEPAIIQPSPTKPNPSPVVNPVQPTPAKPGITQPVPSEPVGTQPVSSQPVEPEPNLQGSGSNFVVKAGFDKGFVVFFKNSFQSFAYSLLGPFPWQFTKTRQMVALAETIPWYILIIVSFYSLSRFIKKKGMLGFLTFYKFTLPLLIFSMLAILALSLYINNYGIIVRIRIPMFLCLISAMLISFNDFESYYYKKMYEKISYYWGRGVHRFPFIRGAFKRGQ